MAEIAMTTETARPAPMLQQVRLMSATVESSLHGGPRELNVKVSRGVDVELRTAEPDGSLLAVVIARLGATAFVADESSPLATLTAVYEGAFNFAKGTDQAHVQAYMQDREYQREMVIQAFPVAFAMFREQLGAMGLQAGTLPLTPP